MRAASWGLVAKARSSGMPAFRQRSGSSVQERGTYRLGRWQRVRGPRSTRDRRRPGVLDAAGRAGVLALDADGRRALLQIARLVDHEHRLVVGEVLDDVGAHVIADRVGVPLRTVQQVLHAVRGRVARMLGQRPAVLPRQVRQQSEHQRGCATSGFDPSEPARHAAHQLVEHRPPPGRHYAVTRGHRLIFVCPHNSR